MCKIKINIVTMQTINSNLTTLRPVGCLVLNIIFAISTIPMRAVRFFRQSCLRSLFPLYCSNCRVDERMNYINEALQNLQQHDCNNQAHQRILTERMNNVVDILKNVQDQTINFSSKLQSGEKLLNRLVNLDKRLASLENGLDNGLDNIGNRLTNLDSLEIRLHENFDNRLESVVKHFETMTSKSEMRMTALETINNNKLNAKVVSNRDKKHNFRFFTTK